VQTNQRMTAKIIHERKDLIPGELWTADQKFF
jgi:hypothetical protein